LLLAVQPAGAVTVRVATFNILQGFEAPGTDSFEQAAAVMARVDADIVGVVEARSGTNEAVYFRQMAERLGYPYAVLSGTTPLDTTLRTAVFSRFPIVMTNWVQSPVGAVEMTRQNLGVKIDVPGTPNDPLIVVVHPKCCSSSSGQESFRRAIEMRRVREFVEANSIPALDNVFVVGDFNLVGTDNIEFGSLPSGLPQRYVLGSDVVWPVEYRRDPDFYFSTVSMARVPMAQVNGATKTWSTRTSSSSVLDYIMASAPVRSRPFRTEVYNSALDVAGAGLPKTGPVPATNASSLASDHYLLFGDFDLGPPPPAPVLEWPSAGSLIEGQRLAASVLTGGVAGVAGGFSFALPDFVPPQGDGSYALVFTPSDVENYGPVTNQISVTVTSAGPGSATFETWLDGQTPSAELLLRYTLGGATSPTATDGVPPQTTLTGNNLSITAIVRTNDPNLSVVGQAVTDLVGGAWSANGVTMAPAGDQGGVPEGCQRQIFSTPRGLDGKKFLRLESTLSAQ
jgi:endonuclease/exonuclease/phosphatase family metal-dependent hydrolase